MPLSCVIDSTSMQWLIEDLRIRIACDASLNKFVLTEANIYETELWRNSMFRSSTDDD